MSAQLAERTPGSAIDWKTFVHVPTAAGVRELFYGPNEFLSLGGSDIPGQILFYLLTTTLIFNVAFVSWHLCEKHFLRLRHSTVFRTRTRLRVHLQGAPLASGNVQRLSPDLGTRRRRDEPPQTQKRPLEQMP